MSLPSASQPTNNHSIASGDAWIELIRQASLLCQAFRLEVVRHAQQWQVGEAELFLLWACRHATSSGMGQKELAQTMAISPAHVSGLVERLRRQGLLTGQRDPGDRRRQCWQLTPKGRQVIQHIQNDLSEQTTAMASEFNSVDIATMTRLIERATGALQGPASDSNTLRGAA